MSVVDNSRGELEALMANLVMEAELVGQGFHRLKNRLAMLKTADKIDKILDVLYAEKEAQ